jgi:hypothetical protein
MGRVLVVNGVSVALDETAREVSERQVLPSGGLRERFEQQRPITALHRRKSHGYHHLSAAPAFTLRRSSSDLATANLKAGGATIRSSVELATVRLALRRRTERDHPLARSNRVFRRISVAACL